MKLLLALLFAMILASTDACQGLTFRNDWDCGGTLAYQFQHGVCHRHWIVVVDPDNTTWQFSSTRVRCNPRECVWECWRDNECASTPFECAVGNRALSCLGCFDINYPWWRTYIDAEIMRSWNGVGAKNDTWFETDKRLQFRSAGQLFAKTTKQSETQTFS